MLTLAVTLAAGIGAVCRYLLDRLVSRRLGGTFPWGTFCVNVSGSLLLGLVVGLAAHHHVGGDVALVVGAGFAGGYTTLSTWTWESVWLVQRGAVAMSWVNVAGSLAAGLVSAAAGLGLALI